MLFDLYKKKKKACDQVNDLSTKEKSMAYLPFLEMSKNSNDLNQFVFYLFIIYFLYLLLFFFVSSYFFFKKKERKRERKR
jgi:hypothetical protein